jgi:predicted metal-dependent hydrolase
MMSNIWKIMSSSRAAEPVFRSGNRDVPLKVVRSARAARMSLRLAEGGAVVRLTLPRRAPLAPALLWVESKRGWVEGQLAGLPMPQPVEPGMAFSLAGQNVVLDWAEGRPRRMKRDGDRLIAGGPRDGLEGRVLRWLRAEAKRMLTEETARYAALAGVSVRAVGVGDPVSRWGSCAVDGTIRYSWRLILAPYAVMEATVAHEVAHRVHMNHGRAFHALVQALLGRNPAAERRWLSAHGKRLHAFGKG